MNFESKFNNFEQKENVNPKIEIGNFSDVESSINFSVINKTLSNKWGNEQNEDIANSIKNSNLNFDDSRKQFEDILELSDHNEETLNWLAFSVDKNESIKNSIIDNITKHKRLSEENAVRLFEKFSDFYHINKQKINTNDLFETFIFDDINSRQEALPELSEKINKAVDFFNPKNLSVKEIVYLPTNPLENKQSGSGIDTGKTSYVNTEKWNEVNQVHEFLHFIVNPIIEKLELSQEDEENILKIASEKIKDYQFPKSILTEEIIRTYKTGLNFDNKPGFNNFKQRLLNLSREKLQDILDSEKEGQSVSVGELLSDDNLIKSYYEKYDKNELSERIWTFFENFKNSESDNFEEYFLKNYKDILLSNFNENEIEPKFEIKKENIIPLEKLPDNLSDEIKSLGWPLECQGSGRFLEDGKNFEIRYPHGDMFYSWNVIFHELGHLRQEDFNQEINDTQEEHERNLKKEKDAFARGLERVKKFKLELIDELEFEFAKYKQAGKIPSFNSFVELYNDFNANNLRINETLQFSDSQEEIYTKLKGINISDFFQEIERNKIGVKIDTKGANEIIFDIVNQIIKEK